MEQILIDMTSPALNPFSAAEGGATDRERERAVDVSAAMMTRLRTPFLHEGADGATADETVRR
ncbi:hypothetical protein [Micromonospora sp. NPDC005299]|uniref:hypothetical protein n=1 Tax=Micromonospora sp. NPDC005299 TaxID=3364231 RepID=UPI0036CDF3BB